ncbi:hypothetical protein M407DRAFT_120577 [Tulasnella calospora MUT 4182]|uniref:Uncharacterized protein n=1 Tax=Tulasnella calospora MUT 4182 TaxID=1051891 RepID=A0A0C3QAW3_9AGAM|nr:hypothetical protein M407DRAFT_120577 [Tulasnella calospora MUT 4182]
MKTRMRALHCIKYSDLSCTCNQSNTALCAICHSNSWPGVTGNGGRCRRKVWIQVAVSLTPAEIPHLITITMNEQLNILLAA